MCMDKLKPIDRCLIRSIVRWPIWFTQGVFDKTLAEGETISAIDFLCNKVSFGFADLEEGGFKPIMALEDRRSAVFEDLSDDDFLGIRKITQLTENPFVLSKLYGVLYQKSGCAQDEKDFIGNLERAICILMDEGKARASVPFLRRLLFLCKGQTNSKELVSFVQEEILPKAADRPDMLLMVLDTCLSFFEEYHCCSKAARKNLVAIAKQCDISASDNELELIRRIINYYSSEHDEKEADIWRDRFADACVELCDKHSPNGYHYIAKALDVMLRKKDNWERINDLLFKREAAEADFFNSMKFEKIPLGDSLAKTIDEFLEACETAFRNEKDSIRRFALFRSRFGVVKQKDIRRHIDDANSSAFEPFFDEIIFSEDKRIVAEIGAENTSMKTKRHTSEAYQLFHGLLAPICKAYLDKAKPDEKLKELLVSIASRNELVPVGRNKVVAEAMIDGLNGHIRKAAFVLIPQFEYGCSIYLKTQRHIYPAKIQNHRIEPLELNAMLMSDPYQNAIADLLGGDLTKELQYLLVEKTYGNLRNRFAHEGYGDEDAYTSIELVAFFRLIDAYCMAYQGDEGSDHN